MYIWEMRSNSTQVDILGLSVLVEDFLKNIALDVVQSAPESGEIKKIEIADWVKKLTLSKIPTPDFDHKEEYHKHLEEKYGLWN